MAVGAVRDREVDPSEQIDLAADFRIRDQQTWEQWYGMNHACPELL